jgi:hypothetical protein
MIRQAKLTTDSNAVRGDTAQAPRPRSERHQLAYSIHAPEPRDGQTVTLLAEEVQAFAQICTVVILDLGERLEDLKTPPH